MIGVSSVSIGSALQSTVGPRMIVRLELISTAFAGGPGFGSTGRYEQLRGHAYFALDPRHPLNKET
jgi:hypothetical protein